MMTPSQRGIYRDIIDLAYKHSNKIPYTVTQLSRYTNATEDEVKEILDMKAEFEAGFWSVPSCQKRIEKTERNRSNGSKGGRPKNPKQNPEDNPEENPGDNPEENRNNNPERNPEETQSKRQIEREREREIEKKEKEKAPPNPHSGVKRPRNVQEVEEFFLNECELAEFSAIEAEKYWDHFKGNGWKVGGRAPMQDWKATARNWARRVDKPKTKIVLK